MLGGANVRKYRGAVSELAADVAGGSVGLNAVAVNGLPGIPVARMGLPPLLNPGNVFDTHRSPGGKKNSPQCRRLRLLCPFIGRSSPNPPMLEEQDVTLIRPESIVPRLRLAIRQRNRCTKRGTKAEHDR